MSAVVQKSALNIVMGAMTFGEKGKGGVRVDDINDVKAILEIFASHGHTEIDTSQVYGQGTSEQYLGKLKPFLDEKGLKIETKLYPSKAFFGTSHTPECLREYLNRSLKALNTDCLEIYYLHGPDRETPYEVTLKAINDLYKEGHFKRFGISNYMSWEVAEMVGICKANGYIQPTVYQGLYNAVHRLVEPELFPCLRKFGISFYEFNPLGGGFFTGRYTSMEDNVEEGSRFDASTFQGKGYRERYWKDAYFKALESIRTVSDKHGLTMPEVALRWISHHSLLKREHGDAVLIGASSLNHIKQNLVDFEKGPLPEEVLKVLDEAGNPLSPMPSNTIIDMIVRNEDLEMKG
ncbi:Aldo/keto reductase [Cyathus striatus]|nr:Aldo/keto reductase [Cyathus striatus]